MVWGWSEEGFLLLPKWKAMGDANLVFQEGLLLKVSQCKTGQNKIRNRTRGREMSLSAAHGQDGREAEGVFCLERIPGETSGQSKFPSCPSRLDKRQLNPSSSRSGMGTAGKWAALVSVSQGS